MGICDSACNSSNDKETKKLTSKTTPVQSNNITSFNKYTDSKNITSYKKYNNYNNTSLYKDNDIHLKVKMPVKIIKKNPLTQLQIIEPQQIRPFFFPNNPINSLQPQTIPLLQYPIEPQPIRQIYPSHNLEPPTINRLFEPVYPKHILSPDFNSFDIYYLYILGKGQFGTVYLGNNKFTNEKVAIKMELKNLIY